MSDVFLKLLNMSFTSSFIIIAVIVLRFLLKRAPKQMVCLLWGLVAIRLVCPFSLESALSLVPSSSPIPSQIEYMEKPAIQSGVTIIDNVVNPIISDTFAPDVTTSINPLQIWVFIASIIWAVGLAVMLSYAGFRYMQLHKRVRASILLEEKIYICDDIDSPFILGIVKPRIYLPSGMNESAHTYVIAHEKAHLKRLDHMWKPLGFLLLSIYWFNPLIWVAYVLLCKDIELACDEKVIADMGLEEKKAYSTALISCSTSRKMIAACPLAFGEVGVKERVTSVLNYKKPAFWIILISILGIIVVAACFLTNPKEENTNIAATQESINNNEESNSGMDESRSQETEEPTSPPEAEAKPTLHQVMDRILSKIPLENATPFITTADLSPGDQLYLLDETVGGTFSLYGFHSDEYDYSGMLINYKIDGEDNWNYLDDITTWVGYESPQIAEADNGGLFLTYCYGGGSGVHMDRFFYFQPHETGTLERYELTNEMITNQLDGLVSFQLNEESKEVQIFAKEGGTEQLFALMSYTDSLYSEDVTIYDVICRFDHVRFLTEPAMLIIGVGLTVEGSIMPVHIGELAFQITAEPSGDGINFRLHDVSTYNSYGIFELTELSKDDAISLLTEQLILAYENKFGDYQPSDIEPTLYSDDSERLAYIIPRLSVTEETEDYYVIPVIWDFRVYKHTGRITIYYNGIDPLEFTFDPMNINHLAFAG